MIITLGNCLAVCIKTESKQFHLQIYRYMKYVNMVTQRHVQGIIVVNKQNKKELKFPTVECTSAFWHIHKTKYYSSVRINQLQATQFKHFMNIMFHKSSLRGQRLGLQLYVAPTPGLWCWCQHDGFSLWVVGEDRRGDLQESDPVLLYNSGSGFKGVLTTPLKFLGLCS